MIRITTLILGIPVILIQLIRPELVPDYSTLAGVVPGTPSKYLIEWVIVGSELTERILKLKQARFHLFSPLMNVTIKRMGS